MYTYLSPNSGIYTITSASVLGRGHFVIIRQLILYIARSGFLDVEKYYYHRSFYMGKIQSLNQFEFWIGTDYCLRVMVNGNDDDVLGITLHTHTREKNLLLCITFLCRNIANCWKSFEAASIFLVRERGILRLSCRQNR